MYNNISIYTHICLGLESTWVMGVPGSRLCAEPKYAMDPDHIAKLASMLHLSFWGRDRTKVMK